MPDLTIEVRKVCRSNLFWQRTVTGSKGDQYVVLWAQGTGENQYDWHCDCAGFHFRGTCRHIEQVKGERCAAGEDAFAGGSGLPMDAEVCPKCGGDVAYIKVAV